MCYIVLKCYIIFLWEGVQLGFISVTLHFVTCDNSRGGWEFSSVTYCLVFVIGTSEKCVTPTRFVDSVSYKNVCMR